MKQEKERVLEGFGCGFTCGSFLSVKSVSFLSKPSLYGYNSDLVERCLLAGLKSEEHGLRKYQLAQQAQLHCNPGQQGDRFCFFKSVQSILSAYYYTTEYLQCSIILVEKYSNL